MNLIREVQITGFDENETPIVRIFDNNQTYLIFEIFPPENDKLSGYQIDNFSKVLTDITGVNVVQDDRELFIIYSNKDNVINKIISFLESLE